MNNLAGFLLALSASLTASQAQAKSTWQVPGPCGVFCKQALDEKIALCHPDTEGSIKEKISKAKRADVKQNWELRLAMWKHTCEGWQRYLK